MGTTTRDGRLIRRLYHPQTVRMMRTVIPSEKVLYRRLAKLRRARLVHVIGYLAGDNGRPRDVYADRKWKSDNVEHEVALSRVLLHWGVDALRGEDVDRQLRPDATIGGLHVEMDTGAMNLRRVESRLREYTATDDRVLVITRSPARGDRILDRCGFLADRLWCCSYEAALRPPADIIVTSPGEQKPLRNLLQNLSDNPGDSQHPLSPQPVRT